LPLGPDRRGEHRVELCLVQEADVRIGLVRRRPLQTGESELLDVVLADAGDRLFAEVRRDVDP
jgi:hypothetical protein